MYECTRQYRDTDRYNSAFRTWSSSMALSSAPACFLCYTLRDTFFINKTRICSFKRFNSKMRKKLRRPRPKSKIVTFSLPQTCRKCAEPNNVAPNLTHGPSPLYQDQPEAKRRPGIQDQERRETQWAASFYSTAAAEDPPREQDSAV